MFRDGDEGYRLLCWKHGILGQRTEAHPLRRVQALIRHRGAEADAIMRWVILCDMRADVALVHERGEG